MGLKDKGGDKITEEDEIKRKIAELCIMTFGHVIYDKAKKEGDGSFWWNLAENIGKNMEEDPEKYYEIFEGIINIFKGDEE